MELSHAFATILAIRFLDADPARPNNQEHCRAGSVCAQPLHIGDSRVDESQIKSIVATKWALCNGRQAGVGPALPPTQFVDVSCFEGNESCVCVWVIGW